MLVSTIVSYAALGDLKQTSLSDIGVEGARSVEQQLNLDTLVGFVNQAVLELHKRFPIKVEIEQEKFNKVSANDDAFTLPETALELIKVEHTDGTEVPVDDYDIESRFKLGAYDGVYIKTVAVNSYRIMGNVPSGGITLEFYYKASPGLLRYTSKIEVPATYQEALINYVAYRGYSTVKSVTQAGDEGLNYKKKFEDSCLRIEQNTDTLYEWANPKRLEQRGFI